MEHVDMKSYTVAIDIRCLFFDSIVLDHHWSTVSFWGADKGQRLNRQVSTSVAMGLCGLFTLQVPKPKTAKCVCNWSCPETPRPDISDIQNQKRVTFGGIVRNNWPLAWFEKYQYIQYIFIQC